MSGAIDHLLGLIKVKVLRGSNLAVRDVGSSDAYVVISMDHMDNHKLKTHVKKKNLNPEWNEELTLSVKEPVQPIKVEVYDKDTFSCDDPMGDAFIGIEPLLEAVRMRKDNLADGAVLKKITPCRQNCFAEESPIYLSQGKVVQDVVLRLRNVESGELEMQLQWVSLPTAKSL